MQITKASGLPEDFNEKKLLESLKGAGVSGDVGNKALQLVKDNLTSDTNTKKIHTLVSQYLKQHSQPINQVNYSLKKAVFALGPTGYPFEHLFSKILQEFGYQTKVGKILNGKCIKHEIDIIAKKDNQVFYIECKFHNRPGLKTDVQVALYTKARFEDVINNLDSTNKNHHSWLVSNTKITKDSTRYANCQNIKTTSWGSPGKESLFNLIINSKLHPITSLTALSKDQVKTLLQQKIITLKDITKSIRLNRLKDLLSKETIKKIKQEINIIHPHEF